MSNSSLGFVALFNEVFGATKFFLTKYANDISGTAIAVAFVLTVFRIGNEAWKAGYDKAMPFMRDQMTKFLIVVALCMPFNIPPLNGDSFVTAFPKKVMDIGFETAGKVAVDAKGRQIGAGTLESMILNLHKNIQIKTNIKNQEVSEKDVGTYINNVMNSVKEEIGSFSIGKIFKFIIACLIVMFLFGLPMLIFAIVSSFIAGPIGILTTAVLLIKIVAMIFFVLVGSSVNVGDYTLIQALMIEMSTFIMTNILSITFYVVMITIVLKAVIYVITFPISVLNMSFENRRHIFMSHVAKGFQLALSPIIAALIFIVAVEAYVEISKEGGIYKLFIEFFVGGVDFKSQIVNENRTNFQEIIEYVAYIFRLLIAAFLGPIVIALPVARVMSQSERFAGELVGQALNVSFGATAEATSIGRRFGGLRV